LRRLTAAQKSLVVSTVEVQLAHQPMVETRNRKPMRLNRIASWELRIRNLRVYYTVEEEAPRAVFIRAVGVKVRGHVTIAGREVEL